MAAVVRAELMVPSRSGAVVAADRPTVATSAKEAFNWLGNLILATFTGFGGRLRVSIDDSTAVKATGTIACSRANSAAGDKVMVGDAVLTVVDGAATAASGQFSRDTSDNAMASSLLAAIQAYPPALAWVTASVNTNTVTVTAKVGGTYGNSIPLAKNAANASAFTLSGAALSGGIDPGALVSVNGTFSGTGTANDTLTFGSVVLTLKASAANEDEITIGGSAAATATNTIAAINAHSKLKGLLLASSGGSGVVTVQLVAASGRVGRLVTLAEASTQFSWAASTFAPSTTEAWAASPLSYAVGSPS